MLMERFFSAAREEVTWEKVVEERMEDRMFEWGEVAAAIKTIKLKKGSGLDGFCGEMVKAVWTAIP